MACGWQYVSYKVVLLIIDTGATHYSSVLVNSQIYSHPHRYFQDDMAYLLGDSAYRLGNRILKPYSKREIQNDEDERLQSFNIALSSARVKIEHTFGLLKSRFPILTNLSTIVGMANGNKKVPPLLAKLIPGCGSYFHHLYPSQPFI